MTEEEARDVLKRLRQILLELELDWLTAEGHQVDDPDAETRTPSANNELRQLVSNIRSVILGPPKLLATTMDLLKAGKLEFSPDVTEIDVAADESDRIVVNRDDVSALAASAEVASRALAELDARLNE